MTTLRPSSAIFFAFAIALCSPAMAENPVDGAKVFAGTCAACHQPDGKGIPGEFPPLAGNSDLFLAPDFPAAVVLNGIDGPLEIGSLKIDKVMPPVDFLSDEEIAAVVKYVRTEWGNAAARPAGFVDVTPEDIAALRKTPNADVRAYRASLKK